MPHIAITMYPGRDRETKLSLALKLQECLAQELGLDKAVVSVSVTDVPKERWDAEMDKVPTTTMFVGPGTKD